MTNVGSKRTLILASFFYVCLNFPLGAHATGCTTEQYDRNVAVKHVIDGDTVELENGRHVRFIGINTPEKKRKQRPSEPLAYQSTLWLRNIIRNSGSRLLLRLGKEQQDHYGRILAHPFLLDGTNLSALLLRQGLAIRISIPPNLEFQDCYFSAEKKAQNEKHGVWKLDYYNVRQANELSKTDSGFRRVQGRVSRIGESHNAYWLNLGKGFAIRLAKNKLSYFKTSPHEFKGQLITLRGWVYTVKKRNELRINLTHPTMIESVRQLKHDE